MRIHPVAAGMIIAASAVSFAAIAVQETRPATRLAADDGKPPASPRSSHDMGSFPVAPPHNRPLIEKDGRTLLWAGGDHDGGKDAIWFDMTDALVDPAQFQHGIGKDRIPSIDEPVFARVDDPRLAEHRIGDQTDVIGYVHDGVAKAYPLFILDRHEVVNDEFAGVPFAVCW